MLHRIAAAVGLLFTGCVVVAAPPPDPGPPAPSGTGTVTATPTSAPAACTPDRCGPEPKMPNKLCADGKSTSGPTGKCLPGKDGVCGWEIARCPEQDGASGTGAPTATSAPGTGQPAAGGQACGSRGMAPCPKDQFCDFPAGSECGATDRGGTCAAIPQICTRELRYVCGCDGKTYSNPCSANAAGQSVSTPGKCP